MLLNSIHPRRIHRNFKNNVHYHGWLAAFQVLGIRLLRRLLRFERILLFSIEEEPPNLQQLCSEDIRIATEEEIIELSNDSSYDLSDLSAATIRDLYAQGHRCAVNVVNTVIAGYAWMAPNEMIIPRLGTRSKLQPTEIYIYKDFSHPAYRGRRAGLGRYQFWLHYLRRLGRSRALTYFASENKASLTRAGRFGMRKVGTATLIQIGRFRRIFTQGAFKRRG